MLFCRFWFCVKQIYATNCCHMALVLAATARGSRFPRRPGRGLVSPAAAQFSGGWTQPAVTGKRWPPTAAALLLSHSVNNHFHGFPPFFSQECERALDLLFSDPEEASQSRWAGREKKVTREQSRILCLVAASPCPSEFPFLKLRAWQWHGLTWVLTWAQAQVWVTCICAVASTPW